MGTIFIDRSSNGNWQKRFVDLDNKLVRVERYQADNQPISGAWLSTYRYADGWPISREEWAADGSPVMNSRGYALTKFTRAPQRSQCAFFDTQGHPVNRADGVHRIVKEYQDGKLQRVSFYDLSGRLVDGAAGAVRTYSYRGNHLVEVRLLDSTGQPVQAKYEGVQASIVRFEYIHGVNDIPVVAEYSLDTNGRTVASHFYKKLPREPDDCE